MVLTRVQNYVLGYSLNCKANLLGFGLCLWLRIGAFYDSFVNREFKLFICRQTPLVHPFLSHFSWGIHWVELADDLTRSNRLGSFMIGSNLTQPKLTHSYTSGVMDLVWMTRDPNRDPFLYLCYR